MKVEHEVIKIVCTLSELQNGSVLKEVMKYFSEKYFDKDAQEEFTEEMLEMYHDNFEKDSPVFLYRTMGFTNDEDEMILKLEITHW